MKIKQIQAKVIQDSSGKPAISAEVILENGLKAVSSVGQGRSRGRHEKTQDQPRRAVGIIENIVQPALVSRSVLDQVKIDKILAGLGKDRKAGVNTILAISQAVAKAGAKVKQKPVWQYLVEMAGLEKPRRLPCPLVVALEGAKHSRQAEKPLIQEYLIAADLATAAKIYGYLKDFLEKERIAYETGFEGGLAPQLSDDIKILDQLKRLKVDFDFKLGADLAAESTPAVSDLVSQIMAEYPIDIIEDPFVLADFARWQELCEDYCDRKTIVGDDLTVTDSQAIEQAVRQKLINGVIIKPNQAGTITQTFEAVKVAQRNNLKIIVSHRAQETKEDILADIAVAAGADYFKAGYPAQEERKVKYKRLEEIKLS